MFYTIYKTTNLINNQIYVGKHQTRNLEDGYLGSGSYFRRAVKKYGRENFKKEILFLLSSEEEMNAKEAELVTEDFVKLNTNYNICPGGDEYVNINYIIKNRLNVLSPEKQKEKHKKISEALKGRPQPKSSARLKELHKHKEFRTFKKDSELQIKATEFAKKANIGTMFINNGIISKKIPKGQIPEGWNQGRIKFNAVNIKYRK